VTDTNEHLPLRVGMFDLLHLDNLLLVEHLDRVKARVVLGTNKVDASKGTSSETVSRQHTEDSDRTHVRSIWKSASAYRPAVLRCWAP
jgi:hypothetical protein